MSRRLSSSDCRNPNVARLAVLLPAWADQAHALRLGLLHQQLGNGLIIE